MQRQVAFSKQESQPCGYAGVNENSAFCVLGQVSEEDGCGVAQGEAHMPAQLAVSGGEDALEPERVQVVGRFDELHAQEELRRGEVLHGEHLMAIVPRREIAFDERRPGVRRQGVR